MEFDISNVYNRDNADELHKGDIVCVADTMLGLKEAVENEETTVLDFIGKKDIPMARFWTAHPYFLAYLVCPARNAEAYKAWKEGKCIKERIGLGKEDWAVRDPNRDNIPDYEWYCREYKPVLEQAPASPKYRPYKSVDELVSDFKERFDTHTPAYAMPLIWVQRKDKNEKFLITGFTSTENGEFVMIGNVLFGLGVLFDDYTFLDGTPCGSPCGV